MYEQSLLRYFNVELLAIGEKTLLYEKRIKAHRPKLEQDAVNIRHLLVTASPDVATCSANYIRKIEGKYAEIKKLRIRIRCVLGVKGESTILFVGNENERYAQILEFDYYVLLGKLLCTQKVISSIEDILSDGFGLKKASK